MRRLHKLMLILFSLIVLGFILRKFAVPGAFLIVAGGLILSGILYFAVGFISVGKMKEDFIASFLYDFSFFNLSLSCFVFLARYQEWHLPKFVLPAIFAGLLVCLLLGIYVFIFRYTPPETEKKILTDLLFPVAFFVFLLAFSLISNKRQFHKFFRSSTFEVYVRSTYPPKDADQLLEDNQCR